MNYNHLDKVDNYKIYEKKWELKQIHWHFKNEQAYLYRMILEMYVLLDYICYGFLHCIWWVNHRHVEFQVFPKDFTPLKLFEYHKNTLKEKKEESERETMRCDLAFITTNIFISPTFTTTQSFLFFLIFIFSCFLIFASFLDSDICWHGNKSFLIRVQIFW